MLKEMNVLKRQVIKLQKENETANRLKAVTMEMLQKEREETSTLKKEIDGYQEEQKRTNHTQNGKLQSWMHRSAARPPHARRRGRRGPPSKVLAS